MIRAVVAAAAILVATRAVADPYATGPFEVTTQSRNVANGGRTVPYTVYRPGVPAGQKVPVVLMLPGFQVPISAHAETMTHWASHGYLVVGAQPPSSLFSTNHLEMADDARAALADALSREAIADPDRIATAGHSLGGKLALMVRAADPAIKAWYGLDPVNNTSSATSTRPNILPGALAGDPRPILLIGQTIDTTPGAGGQACSPAPDNYATFYNAADAANPRIEFTMIGANHFSFVDAPPFTAIFCQPATADAQEMRRRTRGYGVLFFNAVLKEEAASREALLDPASNGVGEGLATIRFVSEAPAEPIERWEVR